MTFPRNQHGWASAPPGIWCWSCPLQTAQKWQTGRSSRKCGPVPAVMCSATPGPWVSPLDNWIIPCPQVCNENQKMSVTSCFFKISIKLFLILLNACETWEWVSASLTWVTWSPSLQRVGRPLQASSLYIHVGTASPICLLILPDRVSIYLPQFTFPK